MIFCLTYCYHIRYDRKKGGTLGGNRTHDLLCSDSGAILIYFFHACWGVSKTTMLEKINRK